MTYFITLLITTIFCSHFFFHHYVYDICIAREIASENEVTCFLILIITTIFIYIFLCGNAYEVGEIDVKL